MIIYILWIAFALAGDLKVDFLDVGQGDSILIRSPAGKVILIDGGTGKKGGINQKLMSRNVTTIDLMVATHAHADHIGGLDEALHAFETKRFLDSGLPHTTQTYHKVMDLVEQKKIEYLKAQKGKQFRLDDGILLEILHPSTTLLSGTRSDLNSNSIVIRLTHGSNCFLFTGDAEEPTERALLRDQIKPCSVLKTAHHGSHHSSTRSFLRAVQPQIALISCGKKNRYGHPAPDAVKRLTDAGAKIYRTDELGDINLISDGKSITVVNDKYNIKGRLKPNLLAKEMATPVESPPKTVPDESDETAIKIIAQDLNQSNSLWIAAIAQLQINTSTMLLEASQTTNETAKPKQFDINTATIEQLIAIPGIGRKKAAAIVEYRKQHGPFKGATDLQKVKGIGPKLSERISNYIQ